MNFFMRGGPANRAPLATLLTVNATDPALLVGSYTYSDADGDLQDDQLPIASAVSFAGQLGIGLLLTGSHTYVHMNGAAQGTSLFKWYRADDTNGTNQVQVAATQNYTPVAGDLDKFLRRGVTPVTAGGISGTEVLSVFSAQVKNVQLLEFFVKFGIAATQNITDSKTWNYCKSDSPVAFVLNNLVDRNNVAYPGLNLSVDLAMSSQGGLGSNSAGTGPAADFVAGSGVDYWYSTGTRGWQQAIPAVLRNRQWTFTFMSVVNFAPGAPHSPTFRVASEPDVTLANVQGTAVDADNIAVITTFVDTATASVAVRDIDGPGIAAVNALKMHCYVEV